MTSVNRNTSPPFRNLSDSLVGLVLPRDRSDHRHPGNTRPTLSFLTTSSPRHAQMWEKIPTEGERQVSVADTTPASPASTTKQLHSSGRVAKAPKARLSTMRSGPAELRRLDRREQCRINQSRYRSKQRNRQLGLEQAVEQMRQEVDRLQSRRQHLTSLAIISQSQRSIVANFFYFLKSSCRSPWSVADAEEVANYAEIYLCDVDTLLGQLRCYSQYFGDSQIELQRIEAITPGVLVASATLSTTATEFALQHAFPHLTALKGASTSKRASLRDRLRYHRLNCSVSMTFLFDSETGRVTDWETNIDLVTALLRVLGSLENVSQVLDHAVLTAGGWTGTPVRKPAFA